MIYSKVSEAISTFDLDEVANEVKVRDVEVVHEPVHIICKDDY